jgi:hypothetical protein
MYFLSLKILRFTKGNSAILIWLPPVFVRRLDKILPLLDTTALVSSEHHSAWKSINSDINIMEMDIICSSLLKKPPFLQSYRQNREQPYPLKIAMIDCW